MEQVKAAVVRWLEQPADLVKREEPLVAVSTPRVEGSRVKPGDVLARIE